MACGETNPAAEPPRATRAPALTVALARAGRTSAWAAAAIKPRTQGPGGRGKAAPPQAPPQQFPPLFQAAFHQVDRPAELPGRLVARQSLQAAQDQRCPELGRQLFQLLVHGLLCLAH